MISFSQFQLQGGVAPLTVALRVLPLSQTTQHWLCPHGHDASVSEHTKKQTHGGLGFPNTANKALPEVIACDQAGGKDQQPGCASWPCSRGGKNGWRNSTVGFSLTGHARVSPDPQLRPIVEEGKDDEDEDKPSSRRECPGCDPKPTTLRFVSQRLLVVRTPTEDRRTGLSPCGVSERAMYAAQDAGACVDAKCETVMRELIF